MTSTALLSLGAAIALSSTALAQRSGPGPLAWCDFDGDRLLDIAMVTRSGELRLLANDGQGAFVDVTTALGLGDVGTARFTLWSDVDGDGLPELFVGTERGPSRFFEAGPRSFVDVAEAFGLVAEGEDVGAAWSDVDADGKLDLRLEQVGSVRVFLARDGGFVPHSSASVTVSVGPWIEGSDGSKDDLDPDDEDTVDADDGRDRSGRRGRPARSGKQDVLVSSGGGVTAGSGGAGFGSPNACAPSLADQAAGPCLAASSVPTFGSFHPLGVDWFVDAGTGRVGFGTLTPGHALEVSGQAISGTGNSAGGSESTIGGGSVNNATAELAVIAGGESNSATGLGAFVGGGSFNAALSDRAAVQGGIGNRAGYRSFVGGGDNNRALGNLSGVAGGKLNDALQTGAFIGGGENSVADGTHAMIGGGRDQLANGADATIVGGAHHTAGELAFVGGGGSTADPALGNVAAGLRATVAGGSDNESDAEASFLGGGRGNRIDATSGAAAAVIGGGENHVVGGASSSVAATIGGGSSNEARGDHATVLGGSGNVALGSAATVGGGEANGAVGTHATVPGGSNSTAFGAWSFAAGRRARSLAQGSFVFADSTDADFQTVQPDRFFVRAGGGVGIGTTTPTSPLTVAGEIESTSGGFVFPDGTVQLTAAIVAMPSGGMIASESSTPPPSFSAAGHVLFTTVIEETSSLTALPDSNGGQGCAVVEGRLSVIGGFDGFFPKSIHQRYDPTTDTWSTAAGLAVAWCATAVLSDEIYAMGGLQQFPSISYEGVNRRYDPTMDQWTALAPMPLARAYATAEAFGGRIYLFGGANQFGPLSSVQEYDPMTDSWAVMTSMPTARSSCRSAVLDGQIYVLGGDGTTAVERYDPVADTWDTVASMPFVPSGGFDVIALDGHLHVVTSVDLYEYHPQADHWLDKGPHGLAGVQNPCLEILGGLPHLFSVSQELWSVDVQNALLDLHRRD